MGNQTLIEKIKLFIAKYSWRVFLWASDLDEEEYWNETAKDIDINRYETAKINPEYDGDYLCKVEQLQECGTVLTKYRVITNSFNVWQVLNGEKVIWWTKIPTI